MSRNQSIWVALQLIHSAAPEANTIVLQLYDDATPIQQVTVETATLTALENGDLSAEAVVERMEILRPAAAAS